MDKEVPLFNDVTQWLKEMCLLPYTADELDSFGRLGFDCRQNQLFADKYLKKLMAKREVVAQIGRRPFAELNVAIYGEVMREIENSPEWIVEAAKPENADKLATLNPIKAKIVALYQKKQSNSQRKANMPSPNSQDPNGYGK